MSDEFLRYTPQARGLTGKVLAFFVANPEEELTSVDIADKWDVRPRSAVFGALDRVVRMGLLARGKEGQYAVYRAGVHLAQWAGQSSQAVLTGADLCGHCGRRTVDSPWKVVTAVRGRQVDPVPVGALEIRLTLRVHGAGTPFARVEIAGVEP